MFDLICENDMLLAVDIAGRYMLQIIMYLAHKTSTKLLRFALTQRTDNTSYDFCKMFSRVI